MKLYSYKEFAEMCGKPYNTITANITRGKIIVDENKKIDISNETNKFFMNKCHNSIPRKSNPIKKQSLKSLSKKSMNGKIVDLNDIEPEDLKYDINNLEKYDVAKLQRIKIIVDIKKANEDTELRALDRAKKLGKVIPLKLSVQNINTFLLGIVGKIKNDLHKFIDNEFDNNDEALKHKKYISEIIDYSVKNSISNAISEMEKEADEYSLMTSW